MCGIVGLFAKSPAIEERLGVHLVAMLAQMSDRGPDSAGVAIYRDPVPEGMTKLTLYSPVGGEDWRAVASAVGGEVDSVRASHSVIVVPTDAEEAEGRVRAARSDLRIMSAGSVIEIYKDVGLPEVFAQEFELSDLHGTHALGHTRMATESAVTPENAHPYTAGEDWCLVHNGSLANPGMLRRKLEKLGEHFESDCDTESACRYLHWRLQQGESLEVALHHAFRDFDGFFTFLMGTRDKLALVRDPIACKPAVLAETDEWVAMASEYHAIAVLPGADDARMWEPEPGIVYVWDRAAVA